MRAVVAALVCLALAAAPLRARADLIGPPGDPARKDKITGIVVADVGAAALVAGIILLGFAAATDIETDPVLKHDLYLSGGLTTAVGASMAGIGLLVWILARQKTAEWLKNGKPAAPISRAFGPAGFRLTF